MKAKDIYNNSLKALWQNLQDSINHLMPNDRCFVIALSRKGTRMLELLGSRYGNSDNHDLTSLYGVTVVTELSLPLLFKNINEDSDKGRIIIKIVDDAIYFGSTILSIYNEVTKFIEYYGLENRVVVEGLYAAIKSNESIDIRNLTGQKVYAIDNVGKGYAHYFVKQLTHDFRGMCNTLEYEFPIIECNVGAALDIESFEAQLMIRYGKNNTYRINDNEGVKSFNIVLRNQEGSLFNKIRIYYGNGILRIVPMSPRPIYDNYEMMGNLMSHVSHPLADLWERFYHTLKEIADNSKQDETLFRSSRRLMVILHNYLLSLYNFETERRAFYTILLSFGVAPVLRLRCGSLFCILADESMVRSISDEVNKYLNGPGFNRLTATTIVRLLTKRSPLLVESNCVMPNRIKYLDDTNRQLFPKCSNVNEALSAMLFNQTVILESYSRTLDTNGSRLRFGYTHESLSDELNQYYKSQKAGLWNEKDLHRWIDIRIDNGCMVPQYIVSTNNNQQWERVLRPGENEDVILSHLSRYALMILDLMTDEDLGIGDTDVKSDNYERMLAYTFYNLGDEILDEESFLDLCVDESLRLRFNHGKYVVDYLCEMSVLKKSDGMIGIHSRLLESDVYKSSTFTEELNDRIKELVELFPRKVEYDGNFDYKNSDYTEKFNFNMRRLMKLESVRASYIRANEIFNDFLSNLDIPKDEFIDYQQLMSEKFWQTISVSYVDEILITKYKEELDEPYYDYWLDMSKLFFFMNLLYAIKCYSEDILASYIMVVEESIKALDILDVFQKAMDLCGEDKDWSEEAIFYIRKCIELKLVH